MARIFLLDYHQLKWGTRNKEDRGGHGGKVNKTKIKGKKITKLGNDTVKGLSRPLEERAKYLGADKREPKDVIKDLKAEHLNLFCQSY